MQLQALALHQVKAGSADVQGYLLTDSQWKMQGTLTERVINFAIDWQ